MWVIEEGNQEEIKQHQEHLKKLYPEMEKDPDWLIKKYRRF